MHKVEQEKPIVAVKNISHSYGNDLVLNDISFEVEKGDYLGIVGPNGAGKSTLLKIILGLMRPAHGSVYLFGKEEPLFKDWASIGYVPQKVTHFDVQFPATVYEVVLMGRYAPRGLFRTITTEDKKLVQEALENVGMWEYADRLIGDLSGGQQQRVFIARALAAQPKIIFFDEPTIGVDQKARDEFYQLLQKLNKESHLTLVLISHDIEMVVKYAKHIAFINKTLLCHGTPEQFLKDSGSQEFFKGDVGAFAHNHNH